MNSGKEHASADAARREKAAGWVMKMDRGLTPSEQDAFHDWLSSDPKNRDTLAYMNWSWDEFDRLAGIEEVQHGPIDPDVLIRNRGYGSNPSIRNWFVSLSLAACLLIGLVIGGVFSGFRPDLNPSAIQTQELIIDRIQKLDLEDGSKVELNRGTLLEVAFSDSERLVKLPKGEASFEIEKDPTRPFVVDVNGVRFVALGTIFNVKTDGNILNLIVSEGRVKVIADASIDPAESGIEPIVVKNERAIVNRDSTNQEALVEIQKMSDSELKEALIWRPEILEFVNTPLDVIVNEFNRRNSITIEITDQNLKNLRLSSMFWSDNVEAFLRILETNFDVQIFRESQASVKLSSMKT